MASIKSKIYHIFFRLINLKGSWEKEISSGKIDTKSYRPVPPTSLYKKLKIEVSHINNKNVYTLSPFEKPDNTIILYLHGGGYIHSAALQHWQFVNDIIEKCRCTVVFPDYPLAPSNTYKEVYEMLIPLYKGLLLNHNTSNILIMGDSAGGGLSLALSQKLKADDITPPSQIILLSPWLDISTSNPQMIAVDSKDAFLGIKGLQMIGKQYSGNLDVNNFLVSPINGPLAGLGRISLFIGTHDVFVADARKFKAKCLEENVEINYHEYDEMPHVWMILGFPESRRAISQIVELINKPPEITSVS